MKLFFQKYTTLTENMKTDHASKTLSCNTTIDQKKENIKFEKKFLKAFWEKYQYRNRTKEHLVFDKRNQKRKKLMK